MIKCISAKWHIVWEPAKWVAKVRNNAGSNCSHVVIGSKKKLIKMHMCKMRKILKNILGVF